MLSGVTPLRLSRRPSAFDDPEWIFELKYDGFRGVAYVDGAASRLVSRNEHRFDEFTPLVTALTETIDAERAVLDGEIVCLDEHGRSQFYELMARRGRPCFCAFDLLWVDGYDLRGRPLIERKARLRDLIPDTSWSLLYVDHIEQRGVALYEKICEMDLEGITAKRKNGLYREGATWFKIKNPDYSQAEGRGELFDRNRS
jgi:bifunctional non-homologous end joining protein LigD